jgi:hypothetical protein
MRNRKRQAWYPIPRVVSLFDYQQEKARADAAEKCLRIAEERLRKILGPAGSGLRFSAQKNGNSPMKCSDHPRLV